MSEEQRIVVVGADGTALPTSVEGAVGGGVDGVDGVDGQTVADMVSRPDKVMRIGTMIKQLLEEVRQAPLDVASRNRLREIHRSSVAEISEGLAPELREELARITLPFNEESTPSDAELRIAQAQLVGWLEGLFHGIQTVLVAQQMSARQQLEEMRRRALPGGIDPGQRQQAPGQYL